MKNPPKIPKATPMRIIHQMEEFRTPMTMQTIIATKAMIMPAIVQPLPALALPSFFLAASTSSIAALYCFTWRAFMFLSTLALPASSSK